VLTSNYAVSTNESIINTVGGQITVNVTVLDTVAPPSAVMIYIAVNTPLAVVDIDIFLSVAVIPVPEAV
jgi:hypothetical protein